MAVVPAKPWDLQVSRITRTIFNPDTTAPTTPTGLGATVISPTQINLSWTGSSDPATGPLGIVSGIQNYRIYRNGSFLNTATGTTFNDTGLTQATTYTYRVSSTDNAGNESAQSTQVQATTQSSNLPPVWNGTPTPTFTLGTASNYPLLVTDPEGQPLTLANRGAALPTGVTLDSANKQLVYSGGGSVGVTSGIIIGANDSTFDSDWASRSTAAGVFYTHNMTYVNQANTPITNDATLRSSFFQVAGTSAQALWDQTNKLSGAGSLKLNMPASISNITTSCGFSFDGRGTTTKNTSKHAFYFQFGIRLDSVYRNFYYGDFNNYGGKLFIMESPSTSFEPSEIVFRRDVRPGGFLMGYRYTPSGGAEGFGLNWPSFSDLTFLNFYNANPGQSAPASLSALRQRHGADYLALNDTTGTNPDYQTAPRLLANTWHTVMLYVDQVNQVIKIWMAEYGQQPQLIMGAMNARIAPVGTMDQSGNPKQIYSGGQLLNYPNNSQFWPSTDTYINYTELIGSDNPIKFPGGYDAPFLGTTTPTSYPPSGSSEA